MSKLDAMNPRDPERREMLATLLFVLQDAPEALLREMWKDVSVFTRVSCFHLVISFATDNSEVSVEFVLSLRFFFLGGGRISSGVQFF